MNTFYSIVALQACFAISTMNTQPGQHDIMKASFANKRLLKSADKTQFQGYRFDAPKPFNTFSQEIQEKIKRVWKHIQEAWCSGKDDQYQYVHKYICALMARQKNGNIVASQRWSTNRLSIGRINIEYLL